MPSVSDTLQAFTNGTPGLAAFDALRAEDEAWLAACFVPPTDFPLIAGARSTIVYGEEGAGKTTAYQMLLRHLRPADHPPERLTVEWSPPLLDPAAPVKSSTAQVVAEHVLSACVHELLRHIMRWPERVVAAPHDVKSTLAWFVRNYGKTAGEELQSDILPPATHDEFLDHASIPRQVSELIKALRTIGLSGAWILAAPDDSYEWENIRPGLLALTSSLNLLDHPQFVYKFVLSVAQKSDLWEASGIERRRLDLIPLRWLTAELIAIVERHLAVATGGQVGSLAQLCDDESLGDWLARTGGSTPRGWLVEVRPLVAHYFARERPLLAREWKDIRRQRPPRFAADFETGRIIVGHREVENIGAGELAVLEYLYQHRDRVCTRDELFHKAYLPSTNPAAEKVSVRELPSEYAGTLDNALWRLRGAIEPDPKDPIYVVTRRGQGVRLENV
jgi:DNA-binding winged helix-turn-helix (wHTH) protein